MWYIKCQGGQMFGVFQAILIYLTSSLYFFSVCKSILQDPTLESTQWNLLRSMSQQLCFPQIKAWPFCSMEIMMCFEGSVEMSNAHKLRPWTFLYRIR